MLRTRATSCTLAAPASGMDTLAGTTSSRRETWWCGPPPLPPTPRFSPVPLVQGLLLDLDAATLTVWVNGERKGVMVRPDMTNDSGDPVGRLEGPLRWAVDVHAGVSVAVDGPLPPPS